MNNALVFAISQVLRRGKTSFLKKTLDPNKYQERFLFTLLREHQDTEFGREHQFSEIQTVDDYRKQVPINTYQDFDPYIQRMAAGEEQVLIKDKPIYFNVTSGSTGKRKLIPVTKSSRKCISRVSSTALACIADATIRYQRPLGQLLFPASSASMGKTTSGVEFAPVSTSDMKLSGPLSRMFLASPPEAHSVEHLESRYYLCLLFALANPNLRVIAETFPVTLLRLCKSLEKHSQDLISDLKAQHIPEWLQLDPQAREILKGKLKCSNSRIQELESVFVREGRLTPISAWQNLSFLITARGGTSDFYFKQFPEYFGDLPVFGGVYSSAEATYGIHRDFGTDGVLLALESGFYEFIPEIDWDCPQPSTLLPHEVEVGQKYRIVVTNYNGFYRYDVGDVVEIEGFQGRTPLFIFRNRLKGFISAIGEKTTEYHVAQAMSLLQQQLDISLTNFCMTLTDGIPPCYVLNVELPNGVRLSNPEAFIGRFDQLLSEGHHLYGVKRVNQQLPSPILRILKPGSFERLEQQMILRGVSATQIKLPKISDDRELFDASMVLEELHFHDSQVFPSL